MTEAEQLEVKLLELDTAIEANAPTISSQVIALHKDLQDRPELVHMLSTTQISTIIRGLKTATGVQLVAATAGKRSSKTRINLDDIEI